MQRTCSTCGKFGAAIHPILQKQTTCYILTNNEGKETWWGCGSHVASVMDSIPEANRCECAPKKKIGEKEYPPMAGTAG
jgi:hypothetical protein